MILPGFSPSPPALPPPPPPVTRISAEPAISEARKKQEETDLRRRGRRSTIKTSGQGVLGTAPLVQPQARRAQLLGG